MFFIRNLIHGSTLARILRKREQLARDRELQDIVRVMVFSPHDGKRLIHR